MFILRLGIDGWDSFLLPSTDEAYATACKARGIKPQSEILEDGTWAHWIGDPKAEKLVMNFHGKFTFPLPPYPFSYTKTSIQEEATASPPASTW